MIFYNEDNTNIDTLLDHFNSLSPNVRLTIEKEKERQIIFLDNDKRETNKFSIDIYSKPTYTEALPMSTLQQEHQSLPSLNSLIFINQYEYSYIHLLIMNYQLINH